MDENFEKENSVDKAAVETDNTDTQESEMRKNEENMKVFTMDDSGRIRSDSISVGAGTAAMTRTSKIYVVLGWISAALTLLVSPLFALAGLVFGMLLNKQAKGRGNAIIITNIVLAAINVIFGLFIIGMFRNIMLGG